MLAIIEVRIDVENLTNFHYSCDISNHTSETPKLHRALHINIASLHFLLNKSSNVWGHFMGTGIPIISMIM